MPSFSNLSKQRLSTCHPNLQMLANKAIKIYDFSVLAGHRDKETQNKYYEEGKSKLKWPNSKHNLSPSHAIDVAPYPIDWQDHQRFYYLAGVFMGLAYEAGIDLRWGGDWDRDTEFDDQTFNDLPHFELHGYT